MLAEICLLAVMYGESRNQPVPTQKAVQSVLLNRAEAHHNHACKELAKPHAFSFVHNGRIIPPHPRGSDAAAYKKMRHHLYKRNLSKKYLYFNTLKLGVRYKTKNRPIILGQLIFY